MANTHQKKQEKHKDNVSLIAAGAVIGAGVAVAATLALKNKKNQEKVKEVLSDVKDHAKESIEKLKKKPNYQEGTKKIKVAVEDIKKIGN